MRQWQAPTRGSCSPATVIVTAPQRQRPVRVDIARLSSGERSGPPVVASMTRPSPASAGAACRRFCAAWHRFASW
jgi:hypothetical protein